MKRLRELRETEPFDSGLTLFELVVSMLIGMIVLALLGSMLVTIYGTQQRISESSRIYSQAQVTSDSFRTAVRSSTGGVLENLILNGKNGQLLITRTLENTSTFSLTPGATCIAFLWTSDGSIYFARAPLRAALPSVSDISKWTQLAASMAPLPATTTIFAKTGRTYAMSFIASPLNGPSTTINVTALAPQLNKETTTGCQ